MGEPFDFEVEERRLVLIQNERAKLRANALDRLSTASAAAGFIAPVASISNGGVSFGISISVVASTTAWIFTAAMLHLGARFSLRKLKP
ncbi:hypothetical protein EPK99_07650 [Neorhizobium lilium]|uniref:Uncharacterized protein n=1 Tax=Neorhizobium lilium TaxID=2503024 RepID=A0A444LHI1_9HYPH|nr:hypothetical protein [Neorhizobium lilium]RWX78481.1 hypothetical protein EPK99_07650 [Neorhizobium lilium]